MELCESRGGRPGLSVPKNSPYGRCGSKATLNERYAALSGAQELCQKDEVESLIDLMALLYFNIRLAHSSELRNCVNVEVDVLGSPNSPGHCGRRATLNLNIAKSSRAVWKTRWTSLIVHTVSCGRNVSTELEHSSELKSCVEDEVDVPGSPSRNNSPYDLRGRKATFDLISRIWLTASFFRAQEPCKSPDGRSALPVPNNNPYGLCECEATLQKKKYIALSQTLSRKSF